MRWRVGAVLFSVIVVCAAPHTVNAADAPTWPAENWEAAPPDPAHWSQEKLDAVGAFVKSLGSSSLMLVEHGKVIYQWGDVSRRLSSYSVRKSLISALYGIYANDGIIDVSRTLAQLGIDDAPEPLTAQERTARVVDLLRARSGVYHPVDFETQAMIQNRPARDSHAPGTFWFYNNWDFNALGTIFERETHKKIGTAFFERIARPLHMQDFRPEDVYYFAGPTSEHSAYHFEISARDLARFGLLYLREGSWNGRQIVPARWVAKSSRADEMIQSGGADAGGYEYLWWVSYQGKMLPNVEVPDGTYSAQGAGGHFLIIIPSLDLVVVHRWANDPPLHDTASLTKWAYKGITRAQYGQVLKLILDAHS